MAKDKQRTMNESRTALINGVYFGPGTPEQPAAALVPYNLQLFRLTPLIENVIRAFPGMKKLDGNVSREKAVEVLKALLQKKILRQTPPPLPKMPPPPAHFSDMALVLHDSGKSMSMDTLERAVAFFLAQTRHELFKSLTLFSHDPDIHLPLIRVALKTVQRKAAGSVRFILRVPMLPRSTMVLHIARKYNVVLHLDLSPPEAQTLLSHVRTILWPYRHPLFKKQRKLLSGLTRLASLHPSANDIAGSNDIEKVMELLSESGFMRYYLDHQCRTCTAGNCQKNENSRVANGDALADMVIRHRLTKEHISAGCGGFMDGLPVFHSLLSARRRFSGCAAGLSYCAVSADGGVYACHRTVNQQNYRLGDVSARHKENLQSLPADVGRTRPENRGHCKGCAAIYICGGGGLGGINRDYCRFMTALLDGLMPLYDSLDGMDKNIILNDQRKMNRWLPHLKAQAHAAPALTEPRLLTVRSDSMVPLFRSGDQVKAVPLEGNTIRTGDIICYGQPVICHRVIARFRKRGVRYVIEKGDGIAAGRRLPEQEITGKINTVITHGREIDMTRFSARLRSRWQALKSLTTHVATVSRVTVQRTLGLDKSAKMKDNNKKSDDTYR